MSSEPVSLLESSSILSTLELVVAIDFLSNPRRVRRRTRLTLGPEALSREIALLTGRGVARLRLAQRYSRVGSESRMETLTRLMLAAFCLDQFFDTQQELADADGFIGRFDLVCMRHRLIIEYDGEQHRTDRKQYLKDMKRLERARALGYLVVRLHWEDVLRHPEQTARQIVELLGEPVRLNKHHDLLITAH